MTEPTFLLLPGWQNSGPAHWQSLWEQHHGYQRVEQHDWMRPLRGDWVARLQDVVLDIAQARRDGSAPRIVLVAHSLGCQLVAAWAQHSGLGHHISGALLVAPGDPERAELAGVLASWSPVANRPLPFPSVLLGSHDDPYCSLERARLFAATWGARFVDCGNCGHINADSGLGMWPDGHARLMALCQTHDQAPGQPQAAPPEHPQQ